MFLKGDVVVEICFIPGVVGVVVGRGVVGDAKIKNKGIQIFLLSSLLPW